MLFQRLESGPEEIESEERVLVAPFGDGFATFRGDEAATGCPDRDVAVYVVRKQKADEGRKCLVK